MGVLLKGVDMCLELLLEWVGLFGVHVIGDEVFFRGGVADSWLGVVLVVVVDLFNKMFLCRS